MIKPYIFSLIVVATNQGNREAQRDDEIEEYCKRMRYLEETVEKLKTESVANKTLFDNISRQIDALCSSSNDFVDRNSTVNKIIEWIVTSSNRTFNSKFKCSAIETQGVLRLNLPNTATSLQDIVDEMEKTGKYCYKCTSRRYRSE